MFLAYGLFLTTLKAFRGEMILAGYFYREITFITVIDEDGDAQRVVECGDLTILNDSSERSFHHQINLHWGSGHLANFRANSSDLEIRIETGMPELWNAKTWRPMLFFDPPIRQKATSYSYQWHEFNSFAMSKWECEYKYANRFKTLQKIEFTHFIVEDPVEELTVVVRFPNGFQLKSSPSLRVTRVDLAADEARSWEVDSAAQDELVVMHALRYDKALNTATLRVTHPRRDVSYGIQWELPGTPFASDNEIPKTWEIGQRPKAKPQELLTDLSRIMVTTRQLFLSGWTGPVNGCVWYFNGEDKLSPIVAVREQMSSEGNYETIQQPLGGSIGYGDGIVGRAFKANRPRLYRAREESYQGYLDFYMHLSVPKLRVVLALPLHPAEDDRTVEENSRIYDSKAPYGVLSLWSERADCPLIALLLPDRGRELRQFQHNINKLLLHEFADTSAG